MSLNRLMIALGVVAFVFSTGVVRAADNYKIDPVHTSVIFRIQHLGVSYFYGRFDDKDGTIAVDESDPTKDSFDVSIKTAGLDSGNPNRDKHLKSGDFFIRRRVPRHHLQEHRS